MSQPEAWPQSTRPYDFAGYLGANGQNVYPEEIEDKLVGLPLVSECVVIQKGEKFYGLVYPDPDKVKELGLSPTDLEAVMEQNRKDIFFYAFV